MCKRFLQLVAVLLASAPALLRAQAQVESPGRSSVGEVRQIVTFLFAPGKAADAATVYEQQLKPIYEDIVPLKRFRVFREVESAEPLDLIVVSSYADMAGMDAANAALRRPHPSGQSAFALYGVLSAMTQSHHDQFVELLPRASDASGIEAPLTVFEYVRAAPGRAIAFEAIMQQKVQPFTRARQLTVYSETGRMLVSDGWDYVRIHGIRDLAEWQRYLAAIRLAPFAQEISSVVAARKIVIVRADARMSVR